MLFVSKTVAMQRRYSRLPYEVPRKHTYILQFHFIDKCLNKCIDHGFLTYGSEPVKRSVNVI